MIISAKYSGPCIKCGEQIKVGSFVNWDRSRGIWHLDETDNDKLRYSMLDSSQMEDSYCSNTTQGEEKVMNSDNNNTINVSDLIRVLKGMEEAVKNEVAVNTLAEIPEEEKQLVKDHFHGQRHSWKRNLTKKQTSFCELMALGSSRADAYTNSYDIASPAFSDNAARKLLEKQKVRDKIAEFRRELTGDDEAGAQKFLDDIKLEGEGRSRGGWSRRLTQGQENFCQEIANGATRIAAFKNSGYDFDGWTQKRMRKRANELMKLPKVEARIASLMSGDTSDVIIGRHKNQWSSPISRLASMPSSSQVVDANDTNGEFVDEFVERIKLHSRLFHHAIVARGQEAVGMAVANEVEEVEEAVRNSIERIRKDLTQQLIQKNHSSGTNQDVGNTPT
jgi:hypothetical protein